MHYHCEIVLPPTDDMKSAIGQILHPFDENLDERDEERSSYGFWDWWQIGGRWSGAKLEATLDQEKLKRFREELHERKITVSGLIFGKEELSPVDQIPVVDALWAQYFPECPFRTCPLFKHSGENGGIPGDIMKYAEVPRSLECHRLIFAGPSYDGRKLEAISMFQREFWNGVSHMETKWDGRLDSAETETLAKMNNYKEEYKASVTPQPDWLVVTVDYHS